MLPSQSSYHVILKITQKEFALLDLADLTYLMRCQTEMH